MEKIARYQEKQASPKRTRTSATRTCGFCGGVGHTRRNCSVMENFLADCYKANENWRRRAYEVLVQDHGIYVGGAVKVKKTTSYHQALPDNAVALITDVTVS